MWFLPYFPPVLFSAGPAAQRWPHCARVQLRQRPSFALRTVAHGVPSLVAARTCCACRCSHCSKRCLYQSALCQSESAPQLTAVLMGSECRSSTALSSAVMRRGSGRPRASSFRSRRGTDPKKAPRPPQNRTTLSICCSTRNVGCTVQEEKRGGGEDNVGEGREGRGHATDERQCHLDGTTLLAAVYVPLVHSPQSLENTTLSVCSSVRA